MADNEQGQETKYTVYTLGHSRHELGVFCELLASCGIEVIADVRSKPYSRHVPRFNREPLRDFLRARGIGYIYLGDRMGGMPEDKDMYDEEGHALYSRIAETEGFKQGMRELLSLAREERVAVMCSEEDPTACHRDLLIGRMLAKCGVEVIHIRGDGRLERHAERLRGAGSGQTEMFPSEEEEWKSIRSVLPADRRRSSSRP